MAKDKKSKKRSPAERAKRKKQRQQNAKAAEEREAHRAMLGRAAHMDAVELTAHIAEVEADLNSKQSVTNGLDYLGGLHMLQQDMEYLNERIALLKAELELLS